MLATMLQGLAEAALTVAILIAAVGVTCLAFDAVRMAYKAIHRKD